MTPKEALAKDGFPVKQGKGRLAREAIERVNQLVAQGWDIKGYSGVIVAVKDDSVKEPKPAAKPRLTKEIADLPAVRYYENDWVAVSEVPVFGSTRFGMREVCWNCHSSLIYHWCQDPIVLGVPVTVVRA